MPRHSEDSEGVVEGTRVRNVLRSAASTFPTPA